MSVRTKYIIALILLGIVEIAVPLPILEAILIYVIVVRPQWFKDMVEKIYTK